MKDLEDLTFADDFMFGKVMEDKSICKELLEILLGIKIERIEFPELQKTLAASYNSKSVRLDVFASEPKRNFDIEMQVIQHKALPQRMRYYQSLMDIDALLKGRKYTELKENYVIFICMFDPFGEDLPVYFFENMCREKNNLKLNDKSFKVCYNVNAFEKAGNGNVRAFLEYVKTHVAKDDFTHKLESTVERTKESDVFRRDYMMRNIFIDDWYDSGYDNGIAIGEERGEHNARIETARAAIRMGMTQDVVAKLSGLPVAEIEQLQNTLKEQLIVEQL